MRYFITVAEELHFGRAAARLGVAQPSLSQQIRKLEDELGVELLRRTSRQIGLTDAGREFFARARETLAQADLAIADARLAGSGEVGHLDVAFTPFVTSRIWPRLLERFRSAHPRVEIVGRERWSAELVEDLAHGTVDVALAAWPPRRHGLAYETLCREPNVIVVGKEHRLAQRASAPLQALAGDTLELWPRHLAPAYHDRLLADCHAAGFEPALREPPTLGSVWMVTANPVMSNVPSGGAVAIVPATVGERLDPAYVAVLDIVPATSYVEYAICTNPAEVNPVVRAFATLAREVATSEGWLAEPWPPEEALPAAG
jgi:DNA-binding transcriptional LysR family regulator